MGGRRPDSSVCDRRSSQAQGRGKRRATPICCALGPCDRGPRIRAKGKSRHRSHSTRGFLTLSVAQIIWTLSLRLRNGRHAAVRGSEVQGSRRTRKGGLGHRCEVDLRARVRSTATLSPRRLHWRERDCDHKRAIQWDGHCQFRASQPLEARSPATASGASGDVKVNARRRYR